MGIFDWIGKGIAKPIHAVSDLYTTDKAKLLAEAEVAKQLASSVAGQQAVNQETVKSASLFVSGWVPLLGWTVGLLIFLYWAPQIIVGAYIWSVTCLKSGVLTPFPIKSDEIVQLIYLLFGFGGYHLIKKL